MDEYQGREREYYDAYWHEGLGDWSPASEGAVPEEIDLLMKVVHPGSRVLEIGCGDGRIGEVLQAVVGGRRHRYLGVDVSPAAVERARARGLEALLWDGQSALPVEDAQMDVVLCFEVLEHVFLPELLLREAVRVLRPGGRIAGSVPNVAFLPNRLLLLLGRFNPGGSPATSLRAPWRDPHIRFFTLPTLRALLLEVGFAGVRIAGQRFSLTDLPRLYRVRGKTRRMLVALSRPVQWLGRTTPGLFAPRLYFEAWRNRGESGAK